MSLKLGDTIIETDTGKVLKEEGRVELLPLWAALLVHCHLSAFWLRSHVCAICLHSA